VKLLLGCIRQLV